MDVPHSRQSIRSVLLYIVIAFIAFLPGLLFQKVQFANDLLYGYGPIRVFLKHQLASGHFPLWNPYLWGGQPFFADPNAMMAYPLNYLTLLFPIGFGYSLFFFLHMVIAALGMHYWLRSIRLSEGACRMGALLFALSGYFWWEVIHLSILAAFAWFPWVLGALEKLQKESKPVQAFLAGLFFALVFVSGNLQIALGVFYTCLLYYPLRLIANVGLSPSLAALKSLGFWKKALVLGFFALWGGFPLFFHLIPAAEFSKYTQREGDQKSYEQFAGTFSMRPSSSYEFLIPGLGLPDGENLETDVQQLPDQVNYDNAYFGIYGYLGVWVFFLAFFAFQRKEKKFIWTLVALALLSLLTAWGRYFPLHRFLCLILPGLHLVRVPFRFLDTYLACVCVLAAYGFQTLEQGAEDKSLSSKRGFAALLYGGVLLIVCLLRWEQTWPEMTALGLGLSGFSLWFFTQSWKKLGLLLVQAGLVLPLLFSGWSDFGLGEASNFNYVGKFPVTAKLGEAFPASRFYLDTGSLGYPLESGRQTFKMAMPENLPEALGFRVIGGYNPIYLKKTADLKQAGQKTYLDLMAVRGFLAGPSPTDQPGFKHQALDSIHLYELNQAPAFVTAPFKNRVIPDDAERLLALKAADFNPREEALLSEPLPPSVASQLSGKKAQLSYEAVREDCDRQVFKIHLDQNSLVVFSEIAFPGWKARVDQKPSELHTSNHVFRTLFLPAGDHEVEFDFEPRWWTPFLLAAPLWLLSALLYGFILWKRGKNGPDAIPQA